MWFICERTKTEGILPRESHQGNFHIGTARINEAIMAENLTRIAKYFLLATALHSNQAKQPISRGTSTIICEKIYRFQPSWRPENIKNEKNIKFILTDTQGGRALETFLQSPCISSNKIQMRRHSSSRLRYFLCQRYEGHHKNYFWIAQSRALVSTLVQDKYICFGAKKLWLFSLRCCTMIWQ